MITFIKEKFNNLENIIKNTMKYGFSFSFFLCIIATCILFIYETFFSFPDLYYIGLSLFKTSLYFAISFIICGFSIDRIKNSL